MQNDVMKTTATASRRSVISDLRSVAEDCTMDEVCEELADRFLCEESRPGTVSASTAIGQCCNWERTALLLGNFCQKKEGKGQMDRQTGKQTDTYHVAGQLCVWWGVCAWRGHAPPRGVVEALWSMLLSGGGVGRASHGSADGAALSVGVWKGPGLHYRHTFQSDHHLFASLFIPPCLLHTWYCFCHLSPPCIVALTSALELSSFGLALAL